MSEKEAEKKEPVLKCPECDAPLPFGVLEEPLHMRGFLPTMAFAPVKEPIPYEDVKMDITFTCPDREECGWEKSFQLGGIITQDVFDGTVPYEEDAQA